MKKTFNLILLFLPLSFLAQTTLKGKVIDDSKYPLPGASVIIKGTTKGEITDFDGNFTIILKETPATLVVSYLGYRTKEVLIDKQTSITIELKTDTQQLNEIVVIGYGEVDKKDLSGSVSKIKEKDEVSMQYNNVASLLQGRTSGIQVISNTANPGSGASVRIRGTNSLRGNNEPLYVVDGVIINSAGEDVANATNDVNERQQIQNGLTGINPRDIESIEVLKDASATAIYGSRGANGVVIITTKKGVSGKVKFNAFSSTTLSFVSKTIDVLSPINYAQYQNQAAILQGSNPRFQVVGDQIFTIGGNNTTVPLRQVNWQNEVFKESFSTNAGFDLSGSKDKDNYYISANFNEMIGNIPNTFLNSANFRVNYSNQASDKLKIDTRLAIYLGRGNMSQGSNSAGGNRSFVRQLIGFNPLIGTTIDDGDDLGAFNPYTFLDEYEEKIDEKRINLSLQATYQISKSLKYMLRAGTNHWTKYRTRWYGAETFKGSLTDGNLALSDLEKTSYTIDNLLLYNKSFNKNHRLNATFGLSYDGNRSTGTTYEVGKFPIKELRELGPELGELVISPLNYFGPIKDNIFSVIGRAIYTLKNKYTFTGTFRMDSSSKFSDGNKTGFFPSFAFSWRTSQESFLKDSKIVNDLKFRASWGQVGNQGIPPYQTIPAYANSTYSDAQNNTVLGVSAANIANPDLTWEKTTQINVGTDFSLFKNTISGSIDAYLKNTDDLLINVPAPLSTGFSSIIVNRGGIENRGIDVNLNFQIVDKEDIKFSVGGNISFIRNKITGLGGVPSSPMYIDGNLVNKPIYFGNNVSTGNYFKAPANAFIEGQPIGVFWGFKTNGIYSDAAAAAAGATVYGNANQAGDVIFLDQNGDGNVNDEDKTIIGNPNPDFTFGFNTNFTYKKFDLSMLFTGSYGNDIMNGNLLTEQNALGNNNNIRPEAYFNAWTPTNTNAAFPRILSVSGSSEVTDRLVQDGSFLRLSNITASYTLDMQKNNAKSFITSLKIYGSANNLFTITNYNGYDPELTNFLYDGTIIGVDWVGTPNVRSFVVGVNVNF